MQFYFHHIFFEMTEHTPLHRKCSEFIKELPCVEGLTLLLRKLQPQVSADVDSCKDKNDDINEREKKNNLQCTDTV